MLELVRSGMFGPLRHGMTREELRHLLGAPPLWGTQQSEDHADIWRYGDIEFHFDKLEVSFIFSDQENLTGGSSALEIDPSNEHAARELADMRRQATNERKGLLTRLMGKKES